MPPSAWCSHCKGAGDLHDDGWICGHCVETHGLTGEHLLLAVVNDIIPPIDAVMCSGKPICEVGNVVGHVSQAPAFGRHGHLIIPYGPNVGIFDLHGPDGVTQHSHIVPQSIGLTPSTYVSACEPHARVMLIADSVNGGSDIVAVHVDTHSVIWRSDEFDSSSGIAVLGEQVSWLA